LVAVTANRADLQSDLVAATADRDHLQVELERRTVETARAESDLERLRAEVHSLLASRSWRATAPLRAMSRMLLALHRGCGFV
jgi:hypothetical protein